MKVYLKPDVHGSRLPVFVFNNDAGQDSQLRHIPTVVVPPAAAPANAIMLKRAGSEESLLKSALLSGVFLTRPQVEKCLQAEKLPFPDKQRVLKIDLVQVLLDKVLGDSVSEEERARVRRRLAREQAPEDEEDEDLQNMDDGSCPEEILNLLKTMDPDNQQAFKTVFKEAASILEKRVQNERSRSAKPKPAADVPPAEPKAGPAPPPPEAKAGPLPAQARAGSDAPRPRGTRKLTPDSLKNLLPPLMDEKVYLKWKSADNKVQVELIGIGAFMEIFL